MVQSNNDTRHQSSQETTESTALLSRPHEFALATPHWKTMLISVPFTATAIQFYWRRMILSGTIPHLFESCATFPFHIGIKMLDNFFCGNATLFIAGLDPSNPPFVGGFIASLTTCAFIPLIESQRKNTPNILSKPVILGVVSQVLGRGTTYPTWWSIFVSSGGARRTPEESLGSEIDQYDAEGALLAILLGYIVPALTSTMSKSSGWTLTWFIYPITVSFLRSAYTRLRLRFSGPPKDIQKSYDLGYKITMLSYAIGFIYAAIPHIAVLVPRLPHPDMLRALLGVDFSVPEDRDTPFTKVVYHAIQWDAVVTFVGSLVATLSFSRSKYESLKITVWNIASVLIFGTGASLTGVWAWREMRMQQEREKLSMVRETRRSN